MFGMRESLAGAVTSVFFALTIDEQTRYFHGYYDVSDNSSAETMHVAIVAREPPRSASSSMRHGMPP
ncbi:MULTISPECIES: DUF1419 domain-containing protein [Sinorhizobium/Ensifer group]|uniref:DUF1419 domain-containing protein n=1 Tax=Sinorhizobium/Ensifer group TaxID=227292 RepID=UPI0023B94170|nr:MULTISPECIES: DUF1419 domain-containing protein [Sinorhizobium/Ensifer group]WEJ08499.1 DUF1419 domain-containing protein [Sinorhizobium sp. M103]WEJ14000.1 DUF1419 domain-containing protein [Sinorhizobium sp. K101]WEJ35598.1 DUF1419 domain-containing protein [Sinorhizobium sp. C101]